MKGKRIAAYIIDMFIISVITSIILYIPFFTPARETRNNLEKYVIDTITSAGSGEVDTDEVEHNTYVFNKDMIIINILTIGTTVLYFGAYGYIAKGETIGKKILKIKIVHEDEEKDLNAGLYFLREILKTNALFDMATVLLLSLASEKIYLQYSSYISTIGEILLLLIIGVMVFRDDERGLHDVICKTKVISTKKEIEEPKTEQIAKDSK